MRSQCNICTDAFVGGDEDLNPIAACPCGHIFHRSCLDRWLKNKSTCPQCRAAVAPRKIIQSLFIFNVDDDDNLDDVGQLHNQIGESQVKISRLKREKDELIGNISTLEQRIETLMESKREIGELLEREQENVGCLRRQLAVARVKEKDAEVAMKQCAVVKRKMKEMEDVRLIIEGSEEETKEILRSLEVDDEKNHSTNSSIRSMAVMLSSLRTEFERVKKERDEWKLKFQRAGRDESEVNGRLLREKQENARLKLEVESLKRKFDALQKATLSPSSTSESFVRRVINESPAPRPSSGESSSLTPVRARTNLSAYPGQLKRARLGENKENKGDSSRTVSTLSNSSSSSYSSNVSSNKSSNSSSNTHSENIPSSSLSSNNSSSHCSNSSSNILSRPVQAPNCNPPVTQSRSMFLKRAQSGQKPTKAVFHRAASFVSKFPTR